MPVLRLPSRQKRTEKKSSRGLGPLWGEGWESPGGQARFCHCSARDEKRADRENRVRGKSQRKDTLSKLSFYSLLCSIIKCWCGSWSFIILRLDWYCADRCRILITSVSLGWLKHHLESFASILTLHLHIQWEKNSSLKFHALLIKHQVFQQLPVITVSHNPCIPFSTCTVLLFLNPAAIGCFFFDMVSFFFTLMLQCGWWRNKHHICTCSLQNMFYCFSKREKYLGYHTIFLYISMH